MPDARHSTEFERIARLAQRFGRPAGGAVGIGDDCAVLPASARPTVLTVDAAVEGVHFARALIDLGAAAARAVEAAMSDVAAMGAAVRGPGTGILSALTLPPALAENEFDAIIDGIARAAARAGAVVLGGNLAAAPLLTLTTTVVGRVDGPTLLRSGGRVGDAIAVTGAVGAAALGLRALLAGRGDEPAFAPFVRAWRAPRARLDEGAAIARFASAAIDISDGLVQDLAHLAEASGCSAVIDRAALPLLAGARDAAALLGLDAIELALHGGEDYELLFTAPGPLPAAPEGSAGWTVIGALASGAGVHTRDADGTVRPCAPAGWDHFAAR